MSAGPCTPVFRGLRATVMGLGRFGGGVAAVRFLAERGAHVTVTDLADAAALAETLVHVSDVPIERLVLGRHEPRDFCEADLVVVSPAVPRHSPFLDIARRAGVPLSSEMNLFWQLNRGRTIGVTGSCGKSTTAALIHAMLQAAGVRSRLGGNIGVSLLPVVDDIQPDEWVVLELSSFQLEDLNSLQASPEIAVVTNFTPNHLDRHGTLDAYRFAKQTILRWQTADGVAVLNRDDPDVAAWGGQGQRLWFGRLADGSEGAAGVFLESGEAFTAHLRTDGIKSVLRLSECLRLPGRHNAVNAAAAIAAAVAAGVSVNAIPRGIASFRGLPHRLEFVAEVSGRRFYNDSKATTPEAAITALEAFDAPIVLLAGGSDKQVDLRPFAEAIRRRTRAVALMGQTGPVLEGLLRSDGSAAPALRVCPDFAEACRWAWKTSAPGDVVLLAPGCASYGWFRDYTERGEQFAASVRALTRA